MPVTFIGDQLADANTLQHLTEEDLQQLYLQPGLF